MREIESFSPDTLPSAALMGKQESPGMFLEDPPARGTEVTEIPSRSRKHHAGVHAFQTESGKDTLKILGRAVPSGLVIQTRSCGVSRG